jgi:hypothetical protein
MVLRVGVGADPPHLAVGTNVVDGLVAVDGTGAVAGAAAEVAAALELPEAAVATIEEEVHLQAHCSSAARRRPVPPADAVGLDASAALEQMPPVVLQTCELAGRPERSVGSRAGERFLSMMYNTSRRKEGLEPLARERAV